MKGRICNVYGMACHKIEAWVSIEGDGKERRRGFAIFLLIP